MGVTRYSDGNVTVTLDGGLEELVRRAIDAAGGETVRIITKAAEDLAEDARRSWYAPGSGVTRDTGKSGDIQVITTVTSDELRISVGSTDITQTKAKGGGTKPRAVLIHRPGRLALTPKLVSQGDWWAWKKSGKPVGKPGTKGHDDWTIEEIAERTGDGKFLLTELVRNPMRVKIRLLTGELGAAIAARINRGA